MKVISAILHQPVGVPGLTAPNVYINTTKMPGVKLRWEEGRGLEVVFKGRSGFFPQSTVAWVETESEEKTTKKAA